tara:strand:+ start:5815 stop:6429 length:615 start_codon:yes stop_codon:yes gene_type:complete
MQLLTELESINTMLSMIGASPVSSLSGASSADVAIAQSVHAEVNRDVQATGWHFNREYEVELEPGDDKQIYLQHNVLRVDVEPDQAVISGTSNPVDVLQRGSKLYDKKNHTYEFSTTLKATVVYGLNWDELPQPARQYITLRAGRVFADRMIGAGDTHSFNMIQEQQALITLRNFDAESADYSVFDSFDVYRIVNRMGYPNSLR